ncbi:MAG: ribokinase [Chloroflexota bacterium]|nr:ribokinase [Chloroflexota bacterium]MDQ5865751.1 ribokinase [Chloroflexota bacterium]
MSLQVVVLGSLNMDLTIRVPRLPQPGETITGHSFSKIPGGKGANQAAALAKLGAHVRIIGRVGQDSFGVSLVDSLTDAGVDTSLVALTDGVSSGLAFIFVDDAGENVIVLERGANGLLTPGDASAAKESIQKAGALLLQLEVPLETVIQAAQVAKSAGVQVILNAAPAELIPDLLLELVDVLIVNETELFVVSGSDRSLREATQALLARGVESVLVTLGRKGSMLVTNQGTTQMPAFEVEAVDSTAAGDAFTAAYVLALLEGFDSRSCLRFASAAAAIKVTRRGAQPGLASRLEVEDFLAAND